MFFSSYYIFVDLFDLISQALTIAFTSEFVPKTVWWITNSYNMSGYQNFQMTPFNVSNEQFQANTAPVKPGDFANVTVCWSVTLFIYTLCNFELIK